jgi:hypothetical protein
MEAKADTRNWRALKGTELNVNKNIPKTINSSKGYKRLNRNEIIIEKTEADASAFFS